MLGLLLDQLLKTLGDGVDALFAEAGDLVDEVVLHFQVVVLGRNHL